MILAVIVPGAPFPDGDGLVNHQAFRREPAFQRRQIDKRFEGGARLPAGLKRPVELAVVIVPPADHGANGPVHGQCDQRDLADLILVGVGFHGCGDTPFGPALQRRIQRGFHH